MCSPPAPPAWPYPLTLATPSADAWRAPPGALPSDQLPDGCAPGRNLPLVHGGLAAWPAARQRTGEQLPAWARTALRQQPGLAQSACMTLARSCNHAAMGGCNSHRLPQVVLPAFRAKLRLHRTSQYHSCPAPPHAMSAQGVIFGRNIKGLANLLRGDPGPPSQVAYNLVSGWVVAWRAYRPGLVHVWPEPGCPSWAPLRNKYKSAWIGDREEFYQVCCSVHITLHAKAWLRACPGVAGCCADHHHRRLHLRTACTDAGNGPWMPLACWGDGLCGLYKGGFDGLWEG